MHFITPEDRHQVSLFASLDDMIAPDAPVRLMDVLVDAVVAANPKDFQRAGLSNTGRKAYMPQTLLKLYLYGYLNGISSSRKLEAETKRNIEVMWLLGRLSPDHKTIADYRKDHGEAIRTMTKSFRDYLVEERYIGGKKVVLDGTKLKANASRQKFLRTRALERRMQDLEAKLEAYLKELKENDVLERAGEEADDQGMVNRRLVEKICELEEELARTREQKQLLEESKTDEMNRTDPDSKKMKDGWNFVPAYNLQVFTDMLYGMIALAQVRQEPTDMGLTLEMVRELESETSIVPEELYADSAYFTASQLHFLENKLSIRTWVAFRISASEQRDRRQGISFEFKPKTQTVECSQGHQLQKKGASNRDQATIYMGTDCQSCQIKSKCTDAKNRSVQIPFLHKWISAFRERMRGPRGKAAMRKRGAWGEHPFGTLKTWMGKIPLKVRRNDKVQTEINLYTTAYNLKRLAAVAEFDQILAEFQKHNWKTS